MLLLNGETVVYLYNCMCDASASILGIGRNSRNRSKDSIIIDAVMMLVI